MYRLCCFQEGGDNVQSGVCSESTENVSVAHTKEQPKLHGILRQRSHTICEYGDESPNEVISRQNSSVSTEGPMESDENSEASSGSRRRRAVSFSEYVERTTFKSGQSVSSMKPTLKSKRRRARKREQKQVSRQLRRRRSSSGSEVSSDEHGGSGARQKVAVADNDDGADDVSSSEMTTESESHDTDEHRSDGGEYDCFDEAIERRDDTGNDVGLASDLGKLKLEDVSTTDSRCMAETPVHIPTANNDCLTEKLTAVTMDDDGMAVKNTRLEVTAGPVTVVDGSRSIGGDTSDKSVDTNDGTSMDSSGGVLTSRVCDVAKNHPSENYLSGDVDGDLSTIVLTSRVCDVAKNHPSENYLSGDVDGDLSTSVLTSRVCDVAKNHPSENYLSGDVDGDLSTIVQEKKAEIADMGSGKADSNVGREEIAVSPEGGEDIAASQEGGEEEVSSVGGEEEVDSPVGGEGKGPMIQEVCSNDGKLSNGDATVGEGGGERKDGSKVRNKDAPETMLSWDDNPIVTEPVEHQVTFSNSLMYDLDDEDWRNNKTRSISLHTGKQHVRKLY